MKIKCRGFTLIEVLIALLVLAIGLLGMATLMMTSMKSNQSSFQRNQAVTLAYDFAERMRLNKTRATTTNDYVVTSATTIPSDPGCKSSSNGCSLSNAATLDVREWLTSLGQAGLTGTASRNGNQYTITIIWLEDSSASCPRVNNVPQCSFALRVDL
ncbi:type IV pilus modification protein PilV [Pseudomonas taiwanensis]|uniref:type IV pilus modification protein PilV n=1 Tax=Pseudomonas taiwanensis TaxID=470150 RepID=UPI0015BBE403|nr:type IV pilus modification protein PilV [Pseudomonas taiwanensis]